MRTETKEKSLYQIAIERLWDRFSKADPGVKNEIIFFLQQKAWTPREREEGIAYMLNNLFPELKGE